MYTPPTGLFYTQGELDQFWQLRRSNEVQFTKEILSLDAASQLLIVEEMEASQAPWVRATNHLDEFLRQAWESIESVPLNWNWHLDAMCDHLEAVKRGEIKKMVCNVPPGTTKSVVFSIVFPCWWWSQDPTQRFLCGSYNSELANQFSVKRRMLINSPWYQGNWDLRLAKGQNEKSLFKNVSGGEMRTTSPKKSALGFHPTCIILDDPMSVDGSESEAERESTENWISGTLSTRGIAADIDRALIVVMQRLDEKDTSAQLLKDKDCEHVMIPMEFELKHPVRDPKVPTSIGWVDPRKVEGELLDNTRFPDIVVRKLEIELGHRAVGQLQQKPTAEIGRLFKKFTFADDIDPQHKIVRTVRNWDLAASDGKKSDWTVGCKMVHCKDESPSPFDDIIYITDIIRGRWEPDERDKVIIETAAQDGWNCIVGLEQEPGSGGKAQITYLTGQLIGYSVEHLKPGRGDGKIQRSNPMRSQMNTGRVIVLKRSWTDEFIDELKVFPNAGRHDDQVDAASGSFEILTQYDDSIVRITDAHLTFSKPISADVLQEVMSPEYNAGNRRKHSWELM